ncbi:hypothetical protein FZEAL_4687 [Fusarium zealandicum]|uniref:ABC transporter domain-containing protein n=1 Tax=Fusarium zealandicum TaxID=1053134 RepID=A0A8H4XKJ8_9HYPO|nr:hypothetical protein FZEAL_4687 [Fusarium zealandicum]
MIQSEIAADTEKALLCGKDAMTRSAQKYLRVCPHYDTHDLMNARDHLSLYARDKYINDVKDNDHHVMKRLTLPPRTHTLALKLSGGNKRKVSLAITMMGKSPGP